MSKKTDYTSEEWKAISSAPVAAGLLISLADASGAVGLAKEAIAIGQAISQSTESDVPDIVKALAEDVKSGGGRPAFPDLPAGDRTATMDALIGAIKSAVLAVESKSPGELDAFKQWLVSVATSVSLASKEGGFLGMGGTPVSDSEQQALKQLTDLLGVDTGGTSTPS